MAYERRDSSGTAVVTTINGGISDTDTTIVITDATGWPSGGASGDFFMRVESEVIRISSRTTTTLTVSGGTAGRGRDGTTAASHANGATAAFVFTRTDLNEANYAVSQTVGKITSAGDLLVGTGLNIMDRLARGANGLPLTATTSSLAYAQLSTAAYIDRSVTYPKLPAITTDRLLGRDTAASGDAEELTVTGGLEFTGAGGIQRSALTGDVAAGAGSNTTAIQNNTVTSGKIAANAVNETHLSTAVAGAGITGGGGAPLALSPDATLALTGDTLGIPNGVITVAKLASRVGVKLTRSTALTVNNSSETDLTWTTEVLDSDGYIAVTAATLTVPTGLGGLYDTELLWTYGADPGSHAGQFVINGTGYGFTGRGNQLNNYIGGVFDLAAGDTLKVTVFQSSGVARSITAATLVMVRRQA